MRGRSNIYELHKNGKCVMTGTSRELGDKLGLKPATVGAAQKNGYQCQGYDVVLTGYIDNDDWRITQEMWQQWDETCLMFRKAYRR